MHRQTLWVILISKTESLTLHNLKVTIELSHFTPHWDRADEESQLSLHARGQTHGSSRT